MPDCSCFVLQVCLRICRCITFSAFSWGEGLIGAMQLEGATLGSTAETAMLPAHEGMSGAMFYVALVWLALLMGPVILPLLSGRKVWRGGR